MQRSSRRQLLALAAAVLTTTVLVRATAAAPGQVVQYQGRLVDSNGVPLEGPVGRLTFLIYGNEAATPAHFVRGEEHAGVPVNRGVFTVSLGRGAPVGPDGTPTGGAPTPFTNEFDGGEERWIVTRVDGNQVGGPVRLGAVPYAVSAGGSVPIGTVVDWYRPRPDFPVPPGWEICDGRTVSDPGSPLDGQPTPNLVGRFVRGLSPGAMTPTAFGGGTPTPLPDQGGAGAYQYSHSHSLTMQVSIPNHTHAISEGGSHDHMAHLGGADGHTTSFHQQVHQTPNYLAFGMLGFGNTCTHDYPVHVKSNGSHDHGGATGATALSTGVSGSTDPDSSPIPTLPPFVGMLKIVRVR